VIILLTFCPRFVGGFVNHIFPTLRKTQKENLSIASFGMIKSKSGLMSKIVRYTPGAKKHKYRLKRFWRFASNHRVKPERLFDAWVAWCIKKFSSGKYMRVALDWTTLPGNIQCLMLAIPFKGRAIPLIWHICLHSDIKDSQNKKEERLVSRLINILSKYNLILESQGYPGKKRKLILIADRGFGRASFISFLQRKSVLFVVRVKSRVWISYGKKTKILLKKLYLIPGKQYWYKSIRFRDDEVVRNVSMAMVVVKGSSDPWFLVTNLKKAKTAISTYEMRFQIEEWFKDMKHQLGIADMQTTNLKRVRRMLLVSAFSYTILALTGKVAERKRQVLEQVITGPIRESASIIWFALHIIEHGLLKHQFWRRVRMVGVAS
jgi:hypothetical protein